MKETFIKLEEEIKVTDNQEQHILNMLKDNNYFYLVRVANHLIALKNINEQILKDLQKKRIPYNSLFVPVDCFQYIDNRIFKIKNKNILLRKEG